MQLRPALRNFRPAKLEELLHQYIQQLLLSIEAPAPAPACLRDDEILNDLFRFLHLLVTSPLDEARTATLAGLTCAALSAFITSPASTLVQAMHTPVALIRLVCVRTCLKLAQRPDIIRCILHTALLHPAATHPLPPAFQSPLPQLSLLNEHPGACAPPLAGDILWTARLLAIDLLSMVHESMMEVSGPAPELREAMSPAFECDAFIDDVLLLVTQRPSRKRPHSRHCTIAQRATSLHHPCIATQHTQHVTCQGNIALSTVVGAGCQSVRVSVTQLNQLDQFYQSAYQAVIQQQQCPPVPGGLSL